MADHQRVQVRSYRGVVDQVERRIFHIDRWRLPTPHGVSVRALLYTLVAVFGVLVASRLPVSGTLLGLLPSSVLYLVVPGLIGWGLASWQIDGRAPHHALRALARFAIAPKALAGLRPTAALGTELVPLEGIQLAPAGDEPVYRCGRVRGPARLVLRYPAEISADGGGSIEDAKRLRVRPREGGRAMARGYELRVPAGREVIFDV